MHKEVFGERLKQRRKELGFTQQQLADKIGYFTHASISLIERSIKKPSWRVLIAMCEHLDVTSAWLMGETEYQGTQVHAEVSIRNGAISDARLREMAEFFVSASESKKVEFEKYVEYFSSKGD